MGILSELKLDGIYGWFMDFSLGIKIPVCVIVAIFIRQYLKKVKEDKDNIELQYKMVNNFFLKREMVERLNIIQDWLSFIRVDDKFTTEQKKQLQKAYEITWEVYNQFNLKQFNLYS